MRVGKKKPDSEPDIILNGLGIKPQHCVFINDGEKIFISVEGRVKNKIKFIYIIFFLSFLIGIIQTRMISRNLYTSMDKF